MTGGEDLGALILETCRRYGRRVAFQIRRGFRVERLSYSQAGEQARRVAAWFLARGLQPGDRIAVWSPNMPEYALLFFGAWLAGIVIVPIDVRTRQEVVRRFTVAAGCRLGFKSRFLEGDFGEGTEVLELEALFDLVAATSPASELPPVGRDALCEIAFTSGTTGVPKGVMLTRGNFLAELAAMQQAFPLRPDYRAVSVLPLSHLLEQVVGFLLPFRFGMRVTYLPRTNAFTLGRTLREDRITCAIVVPELLRLMLSGLERRARDEGKWQRWQFAHRLAPRLPFPLRRLLFREVLSRLGGRLQFFGCGGAPLDAKVRDAWERMGVRVYEGYGLTETTAACSINNAVALRSGSVGRPIPGVEVRIGEEDEIQVRGPTVTSGYWQSAELTAAGFADGWLRTGDVGSIDRDGFLYVSGRQAFKIVLPDGRNVYAEDVERVLNQHPLVRDSCVVGTDRDGGEAVHAVLLTDRPDRGAEIVREANRELAAHQQVSGFTVWQEPDLPRTPILKVDRKAVRQAVGRRAANQERAPAAARVAEAAPGDRLAAIIARVAPRAPAGTADEATLEDDLGLDSLGRVELLSEIEEEMGKAVDETKVGPQTTIGELRRLVEEEAPAEEPPRPARWPRSWWARMARRMLQFVAFRLQDRWLRIEVVHPERADCVPVPSILIFNYQGPYAPLLMLRALPARLRGRVALAVDSRVWRGKERWQGLLASLTVQAFPFVKSGGAVRGSLEEMGRWLDDGYSVIVSPEGEPEEEGEVRPFLGGAGLMAMEMGVPVVPFLIEDYWQLFPKKPSFPHLPVRKGRVRVIIGEPIRFLRGMPYQEATECMRRALLEAR